MLQQIRLALCMQYVYTYPLPMYVNIRLSFCTWHLQNSCRWRAILLFFKLHTPLKYTYYFRTLLSCCLSRGHSVVIYVYQIRQAFYLSLFTFSNKFNDLSWFLGEGKTTQYIGYVVVFLRGGCNFTT